MKLFGHKTRKAFTIIELMVVVFIIGVLATIVIVTLERSKIKSRDAKRKADLAVISSALEQYRVDKKSFPQSTNTLDFCDMSSSCPANMQPYLYPVPTDPVPGIFYKFRSDGSQYKVTARSEGIINAVNDNGCDLVDIKQKAGDFCDRADERRFQVSSSLTALDW